MVEEPIRRVTTLVGDPAWLVTGYERVKALLADPRMGRSHPEPERAARYSESLMFGQATGSPETEVVEHTWMRKLLGPSFSPRRMAELRPRVQELADGLFDEMSRKTPPVDFHETVAFPLPVLVICELLGVPFEDRDDFRRWSDDAAHLTDGARARAGMDCLRAYMTGLLDQKRREPGPDVVSDLAAAQDELGGAFTDEHVATLAASLLWAGHETTVATIDRGMMLLLENPADKEALLRDPDIVVATVEEILRHWLPAGQEKEEGPPQGVPRWASADITVEDVTIPAGDLVVLAVQTGNMDEEVFHDPASFRPARQEIPHLTFGYGPHLCAGAPLARLELQVVFGTVFQRFPGLRLAVPAADLRLRDNLITVWGSLAELPVTW
jgi:pentalenolactone synthase